MRNLLISICLFLAGLNVSAQDIPPLPEPIANNAVAHVSVGGRDYIFSFLGLKPGKSYSDTSRSAYMFASGDKAWQHLPDVPVAQGRLAATAVGLNGKVWLFGGYTVAADGSEKSTPEVFIFDPTDKTYTRAPDMPLPVDDMVSFSYQERYIYLVSGWHDTGNVRAVQVLDTKEMRWFNATDYPGSPVFGHAGGIVGNKFVIADGVAVLGKDDKGQRKFGAVNEGWMGTIDEGNPTNITWRRLPQLPGKGHYRMAGAGVAEAGQVVFVGGTDNAYNYSGIGYDGVPSMPTGHVFAWDFKADKWVLRTKRDQSSMDHRGMVKLDGKWFTLGGMGAGQEVLDAIVLIP